MKATRRAGFTGSMKNDPYLRKSTIYGVKYQCTACGKIALGANFRDDGHHHFKSCPRLAKLNETNQ